MPTLPVTRQSLLIDLGRRGSGAWPEFLAVYERAIAAYCRTMGLRDADVQDATQEVLSAVHRRLPTWNHDDGAGSFRAWLFRVTRNVAVDLIAARARQRSVGSDMALEDAGVDEAALRSRHTSSLDRACELAVLEWAAEQVRQEVSSNVWQAFERTAVFGQRPDVVAAQLEMTVGSVYAAKCRVTARLRARVAFFDNDEGEASDSTAPPRTA